MYKQDCPSIWILEHGQPVLDHTAFQWSSCHNWLYPSNAEATSSKAKGCKDIWKPRKPYHVGIHWIALTEYTQMSTMCQGFSHFSGSFALSFYIVQIATSSVRVESSHWVSFIVNSRINFTKLTCLHQELHEHKVSERLILPWRLRFLSVVLSFGLSHILACRDSKTPPIKIFQKVQFIKNCGFKISLP